MNKVDVFKKTEVTFPSSDPSCQLSGNLALPSSGAKTKLLPAIVIVAGSGPIDRNGNAPNQHLNFNTYNRFAEHMAASPSRSSENRAIAVLSYDKRGVGKSRNADDKNFYYRAGMMDFVNDAVEAVKFVSQHPRIDKSKIILMGHSEGAIIMPLICHGVTNNNLGPIVGCIFYCGFGENLIDAMALQREILVNEVNEMPGLQGWVLRKLVTKEKLQNQYEDLMTKVNAEDEPDFISMQCGLAKHPAKWHREHAGYDVHESMAKHITAHCLAITGEKDYQVRNEFCDPEAAAKLVPDARSIETHCPKNLTHALRSMEGPAKMMNAKKDYGKLGKLPLDEELMSITDAWLDRVLFDMSTNQ